MAAQLAEMCVKYKELSAKQQEQLEEVEKRQFQNKLVERQMDKEFERRLKSIDLEDDDVVETSSEPKKVSKK